MYVNFNRFPDKPVGVCSSGGGGGGEEKPHWTFAVIIQRFRLFELHIGYPP